MLRAAAFVGAAMVSVATYGKAPTYWPSDASPSFKIVTEAPNMDTYLSKYKQDFGAAHDVYRNHCLRVLSFARHILVTETGFDEEQAESAMPVMEIALAYHDMGLFTDLSLEYLEPSAARAEKDLEGTLSADEIKLVRDIIVWHHKVFPWSGEDERSTAIVNAVRKGDWVDATTCLLGGSFVRKGLSAADVVATHTALPEMGFGSFLAALMPWGAYAKQLNPELSLKRLGALSIFKL